MIFYMSNRISQCFAHAKADNRAVLGIFVSAGDPSAEASAAILDKLVENGADMIELGMPFSCLLYTSPSPRDVEESRMPSSA